LLDKCGFSCGSSASMGTGCSDSPRFSPLLQSSEMDARKERNPDAQLRLPDGTCLTLYRNVKTTRHEDNLEIVGDWLVALSPREPRAVGYFYLKDGKQVVEIIYDKHTMKYGERTDIPLPEKMEYVFCSIEDKAEEEKYLRWYGEFDQK
jgi:hypothetical protein